MRVPEAALPVQLDLSTQELADLETLADTVIEETLQAYDRFCVEADRGVDAKRWKLQRHHGDLGLYTDRKEFRDTSQKLRAADGLLVPVMSRHSTPSTMMVGTFPGRLEDSLYGDFFDSTESARARLALIKDHFEDVRVVHQIRGPTEDEPFRFCGVVWASLAASSRPFVQQRDLCILVASGLAYTESGVAFGYTVHHSISLAGLRPLEQYKLVRAKMSLCCLKRQLANDTIEVYHRGFFAPMGSTRDASATKNFFTSMLTVPSQTIDAALAKKLDWMRHHSRGRKRTYVRSSRCVLAGRVGSNTTTVCFCVCCRLVFDQSCAGRCQTRFGSSSSGTCVICRSVRTTQHHSVSGCYLCSCIGV